MPAFTVLPARPDLNPEKITISFPPCWCCRSAVEGSGPVTARIRVSNLLSNPKSREFMAILFFSALEEGHAVIKMYAANPGKRSKSRPIRVIRLNVPRIRLVQLLSGGKAGQLPYYRDLQVPLEAE